FRGSSVAERAPVKRLVGSSNLPPGAGIDAGQRAFFQLACFAFWPLQGARSREYPAGHDVRVRFMLDTVVPVGGRHFVDAVPVPGRQSTGWWATVDRFLDDTAEGS